jgi:hypothetical protein
MNGASIDFQHLAARSKFNIVITASLLHMRLQLTKIACCFKNCVGQLSVRLIVASSESFSLAFDLAGPPAQDAMQTRSRSRLHENLTQPLERTSRKVSKPALEACEPTAKEVAAAEAARARLAGFAAEGQVRLHLHTPPPPPSGAHERSFCSSSGA